MRLKEIKPGMAIHCKNDDEMEILLEVAEKLGYRWRGGYKISEYKKHRTGHTIHFYSPSHSTNYNHILWSDDTEGVTEFSDLILPEMTAEEFLQVINDICNTYSNFSRDCKKECPFCNGYCKEWMAKHPKDTIEICAQWKSSHEKKEPEIEWVYRVFGAENYGEKFFQTEEEAIKRCEELAKSHKTKQYARYERVCRVKEVE